MEEPLILRPISFGAGDRFLHEQEALYGAAITAITQHKELVDLVSNKSERENKYAHTKPRQTWVGAHTAAHNAGWNKDRIIVDADHVGPIELVGGKLSWGIVDKYLDCANFFTIDVASFMNRPADPEHVKEFLSRHEKLIGTNLLPGDYRLNVTKDQLQGLAVRYLLAAQMAGETYRHIEQAKGAGSFITEVSMDEVPAPQSPLELLVMLTALSDEGVPVQTIAPKFIGKFCKGIDYIAPTPSAGRGMFVNEFKKHLLVIKYVVEKFGLPEELKLSIHTGSDKFSLYPSMGRDIYLYTSGIHVKTAGTTWLAEVEAIVKHGGQSGLEFGQRLYELAYKQKDEFIQDYKHVTDINAQKLPTPEEVKGWNNDQFVAALMHAPKDEQKYNKNFRQVLHLGYGIAATELNDHFTSLLAQNRDRIEQRVIQNMYENHMKPIITGK